MNEALLEIYRQRVLEHSRRPHNQRRPETADREVVGFNPLCGDKLTVFLNLDGERIREAAFDGSGCAISVASASMLTDALRGLDLTDARALVDEVEAMFMAGRTPQDPRLEEIVALENVRDYPSRVKCALLAWKAAAGALDEQDKQVTTE